jgi:cobalt-zinc-cadmium efflux system protein
MSRDHDHSHAAASGSRRALAIVLGISSTILAVEVVGAIVSHSLALLADAGHMLTDVAGLGLALLAAVLSQRPSTDARTWGYRRAEVLAAAAQAAVLLTVGILILAEAVQRLISPTAVAATAVIVFGVVGLVGNAISAVILQRSGNRGFNTRAARLEVLNDAVGSLAVLIAAGVILVTGFTRADAIASILIAVLILPRTWKLLRETVDVLLEATPRGLDLSRVRGHIEGTSHVPVVFMTYTCRLSPRDCRF